MALQCWKLIRLVRNAALIPRNVNCHTEALRNKVIKRKEYRTENNFIYLEDPDSFGTLAGKKNHEDLLEDEGDIKEEKFLQDRPLKSQILTTKQYADLIKQYLEHKRIKEAIDILEIRMLKEDRATPENYIYNILIGACADVGYTKKAFKLFNDMKRRALKPTGDTYTCLFNACANSPWPENGLKHAQHLRTLMVEKGIEPNLTNYNAMIKAFGRCGDLPTAFQIVDEMISKKIKIRVHTFNHLLQACISDKKSGLRHALVVWRKMLKMREKPNIFSFNLMLKCVKDCELGTAQEIHELIGIIQNHIIPNTVILSAVQKDSSLEAGNRNPKRKLLVVNPTVDNNNKDLDISYEVPNTELKEDAISYIENIDMPIEIVNKSIQSMPNEDDRTTPNLLSRSLKIEQVLALKEIQSVQDKFAVVGGQDDFLKEMAAYSVKPDIKTFTQMLPLLEETKEAELKLIETMKSSEVIADIDFYNMLIKKRCLRSDYIDAFEIKEMIEKETKRRKRKYGLKKKYELKKNIMTYGVLAMACDTKEKAECLLAEMKEEQIKVNIEILGTMLRQGTATCQFEYIKYIMKYVNDENLKPNGFFIKHLESFIEKCTDKTQKTAKGSYKCSPEFAKSFKKFSEHYNKWLKQFDIDSTLAEENPWKQFQEPYPETVQHQNFTIKEPKRFFKRDRRFVKYTPKL
ncbi:pentatricopeptide repeat-containing protein 1, mitochondrial [Cydia pomonella]|uniref:pentatricopeptide repeat-containing protein 1, mitochondrial n=1 Tax=Cydia pomonella TaxID=82600 RepID=UPI002ADE127D|nr:pentatricopeptide repeat-containing protein 1, mitochondrial [Cydia pomonella]